MPPTHSLANLALSLAILVLSLGAAVLGSAQDSLFVHRGHLGAASAFSAGPFAASRVRGQRLS